jgi:hypothetical protein
MSSENVLCVFMLGWFVQQLDNEHGAASRFRHSEGKARQLALPLLLYGCGPPTTE